MAKTKKGLLIQADCYMAEVEVSTEGLSDYYRLIGTDIVERTHLNTLMGGGRFYTFEAWCDEEAFLHRSDKNILVATIFNRVIAGNVVIHGRSLDKLISHLGDQGYAIDDGEYDDDDVSSGEGAGQEQ